MNGKLAKRLRIAAVRHYIANNAHSKADPSLVLHKTYKQFKKLYHSDPYHKRNNQYPVESHSAVLAKCHDMRVRSKLEKFLDPKSTNKINAQNVNELAGYL